jgi:hypothetical protein
VHQPPLDGDGGGYQEPFRVGQPLPLLDLMAMPIMTLQDLKKLERLGSFRSRSMRWQHIRDKTLLAAKIGAIRQQARYEHKFC